MSKKSEKIAAMVEPFRGQSLDARYLCYFALFNRQLFYEAHDVLEDLWLPERMSIGWFTSMWIARNSAQKLS